MPIVVIVFLLRSEWCMSLKDKRSEVKKLVMGIRNTFNASACESGAQDDIKSIELTACALASDRAQGDSIAQNIEDFVAGRTDAELLNVNVEYR